MGKQCSVCKQVKDETEFHKARNRKDGRQTHCKECSSEAMRSWYEKNKGRLSRHRQTYVAKLRAVVEGHLATHPCVDCGEADMIVLEFDHVRGTKADNIASMVKDGRSMACLKREIAKCEVRCANCHRRRTHERRVRSSMGEGRPFKPDNGGSTPPGPT